LYLLSGFAPLRAIAFVSTLILHVEYGILNYDMHIKITSTQNPKVKSLLALEKPRERRKQCLFIVEGAQEVRMALEAGYKIGNIFFCEEIMDQKESGDLLRDDKLLVPVSREVFDKIAVRESTGGILAVAEQKAHRLEDIVLSKNPLLMILEAVEKPGNLGAILRTADAAGVDAVIICDPQTDFYNPNVIRSSVGCVFTKQIASATSEETIAWLKKNNIQIFCTYLKASNPYHEVDYMQSSAIVMGTEATGLSDIWIKNATANIIIPMLGKIDSMNVSNAAAVVVYEAMRQRGFKI
jgi:RNA methyltransferase, TrmH family